MFCRVVLFVASCAIRTTMMTMMMRMTDDHYHKDQLGATDTNSERRACISRVTKCYLERAHLAWVALSLETFVSHKSALTRNAVMYLMYSVPEGMAVGGIETMMKELKRHAADLGRNKFYSHQLYVRNERRTNPEVGRIPLSLLWVRGRRITPNRRLGVEQPSQSP